MVRTVFCIVVMVVWLALTFTLACLVMLVTLNSDNAIWVARRLFSPVVLWAGGAKLSVQGQQHADPRRPTIYVSNHQSMVDIPALFAALPVNVRFVAKQQLRWVPFIGWFIWIAGHILVDRKNTRRAIASLEAAGRKIRAGTSIIMFPEGTRSPDGRILPFKKGPFALALKAGVALCPVTIEGSGKLMGKKSLRIRPGPVVIKIGQPIDTSKYSENDREALMRRVRDAIISQSLELGGKGGDRDDAIAARGLEGIGRELHTT